MALIPGDEVNGVTAKSNNMHNAALFSILSQRLTQHLGNSKSM
jgi:hypothetical protein